MLALLALAACDDFEYQGFLNKPIPISLIQEIPLIPVLIDGKGPITAAVDTGSPVTVLHFRGDGQSGRGELRLQHGTQPSISRFVFPDSKFYDLSLEPLGLDTSFTVGGLVGASILRHFTVELSYGTNPQLTFSDRIADSKGELAGECDASKLTDPATAAAERCQAIFDTPAVGGGLTSLGDETTDLPATRIVLTLCLQPNVFDPTKLRGHGAEATSGVPVTAVVATGLSTSVISRTAYQRLLAADPSRKASPGSTLYLPYGSEQVSLLDLDLVAVVSNETDQLDPCGELALRRRLLIANAAPLPDADKKLFDEKQVDGASAALSTSPTRFAVVDDESPLIYALRNELSPEVSAIDVVLGGSFLRIFDLIIDYPSHRVLLRCRTDLEDGACHILPWCGQNDEDDPRCPGLSG